MKFKVTTQNIAGNLKVKEFDSDSCTAGFTQQASGWVEVAVCSAFGPVQISAQGSLRNMEVESETVEWKKLESKESESEEQQSYASIRLERRKDPTEHHFSGKSSTLVIKGEGMPSVNIFVLLDSASLTLSIN